MQVASKSTLQEQLCQQTQAAAQAKTQLDTTARELSLLKLASEFDCAELPIVLYAALAVACVQKCFALHSQGPHWEEAGRCT